eukprot:6195042-Pleurochrysis_carterae.AAC.1
MHERAGVNGATFGREATQSGHDLDATQPRSERGAERSPFDLILTSRPRVSEATMATARDSVTPGAKAGSRFACARENTTRSECVNASRARACLCHV